MSMQSPVGQVVWEGSRRSCVDVGLALEAASIPYRILGRGSDCHVMVGNADAEAALHEIEGYLQDTQWGRDDAGEVERASVWSTAGVSTRSCLIGAFVPYAVVLVTLHRMASVAAFGIPWLALGRADAALIRHGEWWRLFTALTLHADVLHLAGNLVIGGMFVFFLFQHVGVGIGWLSVVLCGGGGNLVNAFIQSSEHRSIGASTAVFAALGLLAGAGWVVRRRANWRSMHRWVPIAGAAVLLGFLGTGGQQPGPSRVDVGAHMAGFVVGGLMGYVIARWGDGIRTSAVTQWVAGACALGIIVFSWYAARG